MKSVIGLLVCVTSVLCLSTSVCGQIGNFRITEVDVMADQAEVTNTGPAHVTTSSRPFCHRFTYSSSIPTATSFAPGEVRVFSVIGLNGVSSDLWLYTSGPFSSAGNIVHGLQYGGGNIGRSTLASGVSLWSGGGDFINMPPIGATLSYDGFGFSPFDWYIDETPSMGSDDVTTPGTVAPSLAHPAGTQDFESLLLGDEIIAVQDWIVVDSSLEQGRFTARVVNDVLGAIVPRNGSTQWLRIRDQDETDVQNRLYTPMIATPGPANYTWTFFVNLEQAPPGGGDVKPRITVQHPDGSFANAWGIEFTSTGANLVVTGVGGPAASTPLYSLSSPTGIGDWVKLTLSVDFLAGTVSSQVNDGAAVSLPIALSGTADAMVFRLCYRGEGVGNVMTMLLDDVSVVTADSGIPTVSEWGLVILTLVLLAGGTVIFKQRRVPVA